MSAAVLSCHCLPKNTSVVFCEFIFLLELLLCFFARSIMFNSTSVLLKLHHVLCFWSYSSAVYVHVCHFSVLKLDSKYIWKPEMLLPFYIHLYAMKRWNNVYKPSLWLDNVQDPACSDFTVTLRHFSQNTVVYQWSFSSHFPSTSCSLKAGGIIA